MKIVLYVKPVEYLAYTVCFEMQPPDTKMGIQCDLF